MGLSLKHQTKNNRNDVLCSSVTDSKIPFLWESETICLLSKKKRTNGEPEKVWYITCRGFVRRVSVLPFSVKSQGAEWTHKLTLGRLAQGTWHAFCIPLNLGENVPQWTTGRLMLHICVPHSTRRPSASIEQLLYLVLLTTTDHSPKACLHLNLPQPGLNPSHVDTASFAHSHVCT